MANYTNSEVVSLPSKGEVYDKRIDPEIKLRSMTTIEEMKRTSPSNMPYKSMSEVIEDCIVGDNKPSVYDLCLGDYQYLLYKLRVVTYGNTCKLAITCPNCGNVEEQDVDLDSLDLYEYDEESFKDLIYLTLPTSKKEIKLKLTTPRILDEIERKRNEILLKHPDDIDPRLSLTIQSLIETVDNRTLNRVQLENFVQNLPMNDVNYILKKAEKLNGKLGFDNIIACHCNKCDSNFLSTFRITQEFYGPSVD